MPNQVVLFAKVTRDKQLRLGNSGSFHDDVVVALDPDNRYESYQRTWRISAPEPLDGGRYVAGKLGFEHVGEGTEVRYDEEAHDFITDASLAKETHFAHFVIDADREIVGFEERKQHISRSRFIRVLEAILEEGGFACEITLLSDARSLLEWATEVDRVVQVRAVVHDPNPGWSTKAGLLRQLIVESHAETAEIEVKEEAGEGIDVTPHYERCSEHGTSDV